MTARIGLVLDRFDPRRGGAEAYLDRLGRFLVTRGHEVTLLTAECPKRPEAFAVEVLDPPRGGRLARERAFVTGVEDRVRERGFDSVLGIRHTPSVTVYNPHGGLFVDAIRRSARAGRSAFAGRVREGVRRLDPTIRFFLAMEQRIAEGTAVWVAVSEMVADRFRTVYGIPDDRIRVIPNGVDTERFHPGKIEELRESAREAWNVPEGAFVLLFIAHNPRLKGIDAALRVLQRLVGRERPVFLLVCGRVGEEKLRRQAVELGVQDHLGIVGDTPRPEEAYAACDMLLHPTYYDPCSLVVLEALAAGRPVVTTRCNGASEFSRGGPEMVLVSSPRDVDAMVEGIDPYLGGGESAKTAARDAGDHPWERRLREMEAVLLEGARR